MESLEYQTVESWLRNVEESSANIYDFVFKKFIEWLSENSRFGKYTPDDLVHFQKDCEHVEECMYAILNEVQRYVKSKEGRANTKRLYYRAIRSFFIHNKAELPKDPDFAVHGDKPKVIGTLTPGDVRKVVMSSIPCYQAVFLCMFQGALDLKGLVNWSMNGYEKLMQQLVKYKHMVPEKAVIKIDLPGRKKTKFEKPYYTFIGKDSIEALKNWMIKRPDKASTIFTTRTGNPLTKSTISHYWLRHLDKVGIINRKGNNTPCIRYGKNIHEMRDIFRSLWDKSPASSIVAEFCMGLVIDPLEYKKSFKDVKFYREQYRLATPWLNIISSGRAFGRIEESELDRLRRDNQELRDRLEAQNSKLEDFEARARQNEEQIAQIKNMLSKMIQ